MASQEVIKELGTNGGGFFNANSAHPFENPTPFSNFIEIELIFLIPAALTITLGKMTGSPGMVGRSLPPWPSSLSPAYASAIGQNRSLIRCCMAWTRRPR